MPGRGRPWKGVGEGVPDRIGTGAIADGSITEADLDSGVTSKLNTGSGYSTVEEEGSPLTQRSELNFVGAGVTASDDGEKTVVTIPSGGHIIEDEGSPLATQPDLNFAGAGVTATNDSENTATLITIPGGGMTKLGEFTVTETQTTIPVTFNTAQSPGTYAEILIVADFDLVGGTAEVDLRLDGVSGFTIQYSGWSVEGTPTLSALESNQSDLIGSQLAFGEFNVNAFRITIQSSPTGQYAGFVDERSGSSPSASSRGGWRTDTNDSGDLTGVTLIAKTNNFSIGSKVKAYVLS